MDIYIFYNTQIYQRLFLHFLHKYIFNNTQADQVDYFSRVLETFTENFCSDLINYVLKVERMR